MSTLPFLRAGEPINHERTSRSKEANDIRCLRQLGQRAHLGGHGVVRQHLAARRADGVGAHVLRLDERDKLLLDEQRDGHVHPRGGRKDGRDAIKLDAEALSACREHNVHTARAGKAQKSANADADATHLDLDLVVDSAKVL